MPDQVNYYNHFGELYEKSILACPEPEYWTTDYAEKGRVYQEMKKRIGVQGEWIRDHFHPDHLVLDIGCGFGRQAVWLAKHGYRVYGTDTSNVFISIAGKLFHKYDYTGEFSSVDIIRQELPGSYKQVLLLDVLEHVHPGERKKMIARITGLTENGGLVIVSLPHVKRRISSWINNNIRKRVTRFFPFFLWKEEHPYPVPGKAGVLKFFKSGFTLVKYFETTETDYYLFKRN